MAVFSNSSKMIEERKYLRAGDVEISERAFNLIIGGVLLWGFVLNYLMVTLFGRQITEMVAGMGILPFLIVYFIMVIAGSVMIGKGGTAVSFIGYNLIALPVGVVVCACVEGIPVSTVQTAVLVTAIVTLSFMILATAAPGFFLGMGRVLGFSLLAALVAELVTIFIFHRYSSVYEWIFAVIFSLYIGYDWARANTCARTVGNAVGLAANLYLDIINLFLRVLEIMSRKRD